MRVARATLYINLYIFYICSLEIVKIHTIRWKCWTLSTIMLDSMHMSLVHFPSLPMQCTVHFQLVRVCNVRCWWWKCWCRRVSIVSVCTCFFFPFFSLRLFPFWRLRVFFCFVFSVYAFALHKTLFSAYDGSAAEQTNIYSNRMPRKHTHLICSTTDQFSQLFQQYFLQLQCVSFRFLVFSNLFGAFFVREFFFIHSAFRCPYKRFEFFFYFLFV